MSFLSRSEAAPCQDKDEACRTQNLLCRRSGNPRLHRFRVRLGGQADVVTFDMGSDGRQAKALTFRGETFGRSN
jgi:hypothetical protein